MLVENGTIRINRNIDAGGKDITRTIAKSIGLDEERAEGMKLSSKNFFTKESYINFPPLEMILDEISRIIANLNQEEKVVQIDGIILSGGTAKLTGIDGYFSDMLKQKVIIGNPLSRVQYDHRLDPILGDQGIQFSVSIGLALKGISNYLKK
jgi:Tfp pilus assembly PilM family ATPase